MGFFAGPKIAPDDRPRLKTLKTLHALLGMLTLCACTCTCHMHMHMHMYP